MRIWTLAGLAVALGAVFTALRPRTPLRELPLLLPLSQLALMALAATALLGRGSPAIWFLHLVPLALLAALSDWLLLRLFRRIHQRQALQQQVDALEWELERQEQRSRQLLAEAEGLRHLRHDLHNQLQTAALLLERGAEAEARALLQQLWDFLGPSAPEEEEETPHVQHSHL